MQTETLTRTEPQTMAAKADTRAERYFTPRTDVYETGEALILVADVPGATEQGIDVTFEGDTLTMEAKVAPMTRDGYSLALREYEVGSYRRSFTVHTPVDREGITAALVDGVLRVTLPKSRATE